MIVGSCAKCGQKLFHDSRFVSQDGNVWCADHAPARPETPFDVMGAPYTPMKCDKCGHVGYAHDCAARLKAQAAERLARLVIQSERTWQYGEGNTRLLLEYVPEMLAEARAVLGEK